MQPVTLHAVTNTYHSHSDITTKFQ